VWLDGFPIEEVYARVALARAARVFDQALVATNRKSRAITLQARIEESALSAAGDSARANPQLDRDLIARGLADFVATFKGQPIDPDKLSRRAGFGELASVLALDKLTSAYGSHVLEGAAQTYDEAAFLRVLALSTSADLEHARANAPLLVELMAASVRRRARAGAAAPDLRVVWREPRTRLMTVLFALAAKDRLSRHPAASNHSG
jgi:hypothetical protein